jgi:hypothetical protein
MAITFFTDNKPSTRLIGTQLVYTENVIDFTKIVATTEDSVSAIPIPKGAIVSRVGAVLLEPGSSSSVIEVGDGTDPNGWAAAGLTLNGSVNSNVISTPADAYGALGGKLYVSDDTIDLDFNTNDPVGGKVLVFAEYSFSEEIAKS